ncbi:MAG: SDR family NAD(P)-dependent oxidoreductase [Bacillota bacterium]|nr:SDR family NAD(P)-dependent oxidoreductase [Bacillota bacterium]
MKLQDRVAIITGAARGLGQVFALRLAREGAKVVLADRLKLADTEEQVKKIGGQAISMEIDVTDYASVHTMVDSQIACQRIG